MHRPMRSLFVPLLFCCVCALLVPIPLLSMHDPNSEPATEEELEQSYPSAHELFKEMGYKSEMDMAISVSHLVTKYGPHIINTIHSSSGETLLTQAIRYQRPFLVYTLLVLNADPNQPNKYGRTPLAIAQSCIEAKNNLVQQSRRQGARSSEIECILSHVAKLETIIEMLRDPMIATSIEPSSPVVTHSEEATTISAPISAPVQSAPVQKKKKRKWRVAQCKAPEEKAPEAEVLKEDDGSSARQRRCPNPLLLQWTEDKEKHRHI